jgi:single-strand DNA-binding protein
MAASLNKVTLIGNLGKDPEFRSTNEGKEIATFSLATTDTWRDRASGEKKERTEWHRVVVFSEGLVNVIKNYVKKGSKIYIEGSLQTRKWVDATGVEKYTTEVVLQNFGSSLVMLDSRGASGENFGAPASGSASAQGGGSFDHSELDDDIPF